MSIRVTSWDTDRTKLEIRKRYKNASDARNWLEDRWSRNERILYSLSGSMLRGNAVDGNYDEASGGPDGSSSDVNMAYTFKNFRFIHAQMSANPPSVAMRPQTSDQDDHRKADAADRVVRWSIRKYIMQEKVDTLCLHALGYGTGFMKTVWDSTRGDIIDFDEESGELKLEGDIAISVPFVWNIRLDPDAKSWDEMKWLFETVYIDYEEALARWPDKEDQLKKARVEKKDGYGSRGKETQLEDNHYNCVELLEYWETGLPTNGYLGRYCITTVDGDVVEPCRPSPFRFKRAGAVSRIDRRDDLTDVQKELMARRLPEQARLPYHILSDIDIPNMVWGRSFVEYAAQLQDNMNQMDTAILDNIKAHSAARLVLPEAAEIAEDGLSDDTWDVVRITGNQPPYFVKPPEMMPDMSNSRAQHLQGINDICGVNESMFGQQSREQSGQAMQYATNQGNMVRRRIFNKYVLAVESIYRAILDLIRKHWTVERTIHVLGKEKALEAIDLKGADIDGGYDVVGEYGVTLSLDPITRREEILTLQPMFEKAGLPTRFLMKHLKLNELEEMYDALDLAEARQNEIFQMMISTGQYIQPKPYRDHINMIAWAMEYFMTQEFNSLTEEQQALCEKHIEERAQIAATEKSGGAGTPAGTPAPQPPGPLPAGPDGQVPVPAGVPAPAPIGA